MRFEFYHAGLEDVPKLSMDGVVPNAVHFSHWQGNETPPQVRADTSTEIALNLVASPLCAELTRGIELVTNNHFDTDGVLSVWTVLMGERALQWREQLIAAAESGDFSEYTNERAIRASLVIQGGDGAIPDAGVLSPLARELAGGADVDEARAYELVLPEVEKVLTRTDDYEHLWRDEWDKIERAVESFARGTSRIEEDAAARLSFITLAPDLYGASGFKPTRHAAPYTAISKHTRGEIYLIAVPMNGGYAYRVDYPYYSLAVTFTRPTIPRRDFTTLVPRLNELENDTQRRWQPDESELTSALKCVDERGLLCRSNLQPERVADELRAELKREAGSRGSKQAAA
ncbi:hypothetical protein BH18ACI2_BH18ACI2_23070 [soil metagenome]